MTSNWANTQHIQLATAGYYIPEQPPSDYSSSYDDHFLPHSNTIPSRTLNHPLTNTPVGDKGLVAIAKPFTTDSHQLAIAGRTFLKILKIPSPTTSSFDLPSRPTYSTAATSYRPSPSRSSISGPSSSPYDESDRDDHEGVRETMDVRTGSRLGPGFMFTDVRWGYGATANKLATSFSNGAVVLWDLEKESPSRVDQLKYEHDRAVNRVVFGGASGSWLMSGGQDGQMKLWDIRESRPASLVLRASSPVRHLAFSPSPSQPFTLLAVCASGMLVRYDIRLTGRVGGGATDRVTGHVGGCLAMDWRNNLSPSSSYAPGDSSAETEGGGWVVTAGMDSTIKIWDFNQPILSSKPSRTLYTSQPMQNVHWHPTRATELACSALVSLSLNSQSGTTGTTGLEEGEGAVGEEGLGGWREGVDVWDIRREYFPKLSIRTSEPISAILFNEDDTIWSASKSTATFHQHDVLHDSINLMDTFPRASASWNIEGEMSFVDDTRRTDDIPWDSQPSSTEHRAVDAQPFRPESTIATVTRFDPDFDHLSFATLANNYLLRGEDLGKVCDANAEMARYVNRIDASQLWSTIKIWLTTPISLLTPPASPPSPPPAPIPTELESSTLFVPDRSTPPTRNGSPITSHPIRRSVSNSLSTTTRGRSVPQSPLGGVMDLVSTSELEGLSEESGLERRDLLRFSRGRGNDSLESVGSSDLSSELPVPPATTRGFPLPPTSIKSNLTSSLIVPPPVGGLTIGIGRSRSSTLAASFKPTSLFTTPTIPSPSMIDSYPLARSLELGLDIYSSASSSLIIPSSSEETDSETEEEEEPEQVSDQPLPGGNEPLISRARKSIHAARMKSRRSSDLVDRGAPLTRENLLGNHFGLLGGGGGGGGGSRRTSDERDRPSLGGSGGGRRKELNGVTTKQGGGGGGGMMASIATLRPPPSREVGEGDMREVGPSKEVLKRRGNAERAMEAMGIIKQQVVEVLKDYADKGDVQMCAVVCCVLQNHEIGFDKMFVTRVTKAYLDLLRRGRLHVAAAALVKHCVPPSLRATSQNNVVYHTACGKCGKMIDQAPYGKCQRCTINVLNCALCHRLIRSLAILCPTCGHSAHPTCLSQFSHSITLQKTHDSFPSTPGLPGPAIRAWMWGDAMEGSVGKGGVRNLEDTELESLLGSCCSGACDCSPCLLSVGISR